MEKNMLKKSAQKEKVSAINLYSEPSNFIIRQFITLRMTVGCTFAHGFLTQNSSSSVQGKGKISPTMHSPSSLSAPESPTYLLDRMACLTPSRLH